MRGLVLLLAILPTAPAVAQALHPGLWEIKTHYAKMILRKDITDATNKRQAGRPVQRACLKPEQAYLPKLIEAIGKACTIDRDDLSGGSLHLRATCNQLASPGPFPPMMIGASLSLDGPYTPETVSFDAHFTATMGGMPLEVQGTMQAHRISPCPIPPAAKDESGE